MFDVENVIKQMTLEEKANLCSGYDMFNMSGCERLNVPRIKLADGPHGVREIFPEVTCFPPACLSACTFNKDVMYEMGQAIGEECQFKNVGILLGPGLCIKRTPLCGRNFEYFSEDPMLSSRITTGLVQGIESKGVGTCLKHFAMNNQETYRLSYDAVVDERAFHEIYMRSFEEAVKEGKPATLMCAYNKINGVYCAQNKTILTDVLRDMWGFEGFIVSDWGAVDDRVADLKAGLELEMPSSGGVNDALIVKAVKEGVLDESVLDTACRRLLGVIKRVAEHQNPQPYSVEAHRAVARKVASEAIVLLKNEDKTLPLKKEQKVAFVGPMAEHPRYQGTGSSHIHNTHTVTPLEAVEPIAKVTYAKGVNEDDEGDNYDRKLFQEAVETAKNADVAVVWIGIPHRYETESLDREHMNLPNPMNQLVHEVAKVNKNTVVVLCGGSSVTMPWVNEIKSIVEMFLGGQEVGAAIIDILYGIVNPSGKLAETFPIKFEDTPSFLNFPGERLEVKYAESIFVGYRYYDTKKMPVLFPFGHGLSYTTFEYSNLRVSKERAKDNEPIDVYVTIKNTGSVEGKEAVQLYIGDDECDFNRPTKELKDFQKVSLKPGESKELKFTLNFRSFAFWQPEIHKWYVQTGDFTIYVGSSSADIRLTKKIFVEATTVIKTPVTLQTPISFAKETKGAAEILQPFIDAAVWGDLNELGQDSKRMFETCARTYPLRTLVQFGQGKITFEDLQAAIDKINQNL